MLADLDERLLVWGPRAERALRRAVIQGRPGADSCLALARWLEAREHPGPTDAALALDLYNIYATSRAHHDLISTEAARAWLITHPEGRLLDARVSAWIARTTPQRLLALVDQGQAPAPITPGVWDAQDIADHWKHTTDLDAP